MIRAVNSQFAFKEGSFLGTCSETLMNLVRKIQQFFLSILQTVCFCFFKKNDQALTQPAVATQALVQQNQVQPVSTPTSNSLPPASSQESAAINEQSAAPVRQSAVRRAAAALESNQEQPDAVVYRTSSTIVSPASVDVESVSSASSEQASTFADDGPTEIVTNIQEDEDGILMPTPYRVQRVVIPAAGPNATYMDSSTIVSPASVDVESVSSSSTEQASIMIEEEDSAILSKLEHRAGPVVDEVAQLSIDTLKDKIRISLTIERIRAIIVELQSKNINLTGVLSSNSEKKPVVGNIYNNSKYLNKKIISFLKKHSDDFHNNFLELSRQIINKTNDKFKKELNKTKDNVLVEAMKSYLTDVAIFDFSSKSRENFIKSALDRPRIQRDETLKAAVDCLDKERKDIFEDLVKYCSDSIPSQNINSEERRARLYILVEEIGRTLLSNIDEKFNSGSAFGKFLAQINEPIELIYYPPYPS